MCHEISLLCCAIQCVEAYLLDIVTVVIVVVHNPSGKQQK